MNDILLLSCTYTLYNSGYPWNNMTTLLFIQQIYIPVCLFCEWKTLHLVGLSRVRSGVKRKYCLNVVIFCLVYCKIN